MTLVPPSSQERVKILNPTAPLVLPFAFPSGLFETLEAETESLVVRVKAALPTTVLESISSLYLRVRIHVDVDDVGRLRGVKIALDSEAAPPPDTLFSVEENIDFMELDDAIEQVVGGVETVWIERAVARRMEQGRELYHLPDAVLGAHLFAILGQSEEQLLAFGGYPLFVHHLALAEKKARAIRRGGHEMVLEAKKAAALADRLEEELEAARQWWSNDAPENLNGNEIAVSSHYTNEEQLLLLYRDWHFREDGCWPLFNLWGEPLERAVMAEECVSTEA